MKIRLNELKPGEKGRITGWTGSFPPARLLEMGLLPGTIIEVVRFAPLGDPIDIKVKGYHLSVRKQEAEQVEIERL